MRRPTKLSSGAGDLFLSLSLIASTMVKVPGIFELLRMTSELVAVSPWRSPCDSAREGWYPR
jgi:hypothetical protein